MTSLGKRKKVNTMESGADGRDKFPAMMKMLIADNEYEPQFCDRELAFRQQQRIGSNNELEFRCEQLK